MGIDKGIAQNLKRFAAAFRDARERGANEADTVMYLVKFFEEVLGFDSLKGEISKELAIKDRYCDLALKINGAVVVLVEVKAASQKGLTAKHIEQAENYASRAGIPWVLLTSGVEWKLFHVTFSEAEGIAHDLAFELDLVAELDNDPEGVWARVGILERQAIAKGALESYWSHKKALSPAAVVRALFNQDVLAAIRRELNRDAPARLDLEDVFAAVRDALSKEALAAAGELGISKRRKRRRRVQRTNAVTGETVTEEVEDEVHEGVGQPAQATSEAQPVNTESPVQNN